MATSAKGQEESAQKAKDMAAPPSDSNESKRRLPLGASVSSMRVDYEAFEVGTGQASPHTDSGCVVYVGITYLGCLGAFTRDVGFLLWRAPLQTKQANRHTGRDQKGRRGSDEVVPGTSVVPSSETGKLNPLGGPQRRQPLEDGAGQ